MSKLTPTIEYTLTEIIDDDLTITKDWENSACTVDCIDGLMICFEVEATNAQGEEKYFSVSFQNSERNNGMMAYNGYDVDFATMFGCDGDQSQELIEFLDHDDDPLTEMCREASRLSKQRLTHELEKHL